MSKRNLKNRRNFRPFSSQVEGLEPRILLTADTFSEWQNPFNHNDINQDGSVSPADVLALRQVLNTQGSHQLVARAAAEPGSANANVALMLDANGDGYVSPVDALLVVEAVNAQGEGEEFRVRIGITNSEGAEITQVNVGDTFTVNAFVQDLRGVDAAGVFSAYADVTYDASLVSVEQGASIVHASPFDDGKSGDASQPGLLDEVGGFDRSGSGDGDEHLLFQMNFVADEMGVVTFQPDPADILPSHEFLGHDNLTAIVAENIAFDAAELTIVAAGTPDLAAFAKALANANVEFWSTRQFNTDAVSQRELFEDAASFLPFNESLDSNGDLNTSASNRNVTEVNTWIFGDDSRVTGVLSLEELSTRSGVAIPTSNGPTLKQVVANDSVQVEFNSPLHLGLDTYDATNGPVTYTVTVDDPNLVESTVVTGNRGWELDIEGYGKMVFEFFEGRAPRATSQFITLTESGFYDGLTLHRILDGFVIQGGDPLGTGAGGSDLPDFDDQFHVDLQHNRIGVLSMAKSSDDTNNSQFFVTDDTTRHLDFNHTIFGQLIEGFDVLDAVSAVPVLAPASQGRPVTPPVIKSARVINDQENAIVQLKALASSGTTNVTVTATDAIGRTDTNTFTVDLIADAENANPFLADIPDFVAAAGSTLSFQLEHVDVEGDDVLYDVTVVSPSDLSANVTEAGLVTVDIPDTLNDGDEARVLVRVSASTVSPRDEQLVSIFIGDELVATDDAFTIDEDSGLHTFDVLDNDSGSSNLTITGVSTPSDGGVVEITNDGKINYTPAANFPINSTTPLIATFTYTVTDSFTSQTADATVAITVNPVNDPPTANDDAYPADFDPTRDRDEIKLLREDEVTPAQLIVILNDAVTPDEEIPGISAVESTTGATLAIRNANTAVNYLAAPNVFGIDTFTYTLTDPGGLSDTATVTVSIAQVNDAPIAEPDAISVDAGIPDTISAATLLGNDSAGPMEDGVQTLSIMGVTQPANGTLTLNSDGSLTYTGNAGFSGTDTFEYTVVDDGITENFDETTGQFVASADPLTATGVVTITVVANEAAVDDMFDVNTRETTVSLDVLANDDLSLSPTVTSVTDPANGIVEIINSGNDISYTPTANYSGPDSFTYTITDSLGTMSTATVTLNVMPPNVDPTALDDAFTVQSNGTAQSLDVLANDTVQGGETKTVTAILDQPDNGSVEISQGGGAILYTPNTGFVGTDSIIYQMDDGNGGTDAAQVTITIESTNANPIANDDTLTIVVPPSVESPRPLDVLANDETEDGETLTITSIVTVPTNGVATIASDGKTILYERINDTITQDSLVYEIGDGNGGIATATVDITIRVENQVPVANDDTATITTSTAQTIDVLANDETEAGETLTIESITVDPALGTTSIASDGKSILYTPNAGANGTDTFTYQINDGSGGTDTAVVTLTLDVANLDPVANSDTLTIMPFGEQTLDVLANDQGETGETLIITATGGTPTGTVTINSDGTGLLYTPATGSAGTTDTFTYTVSDGNGGSADGTVTLNIDSLSNSFFAGSVFQDFNDDGLQSSSEKGIGGVMVVLEGTDVAGATVRRETRTSLQGDYRFDQIVPGDYTITQMQPEFLTSGNNTFGLTVTQDDTFEFQVSDQLIESDDNNFAERGLSARFAMLSALSSSRAPGVFVVLEGDELAWVEDRGGWDDVDSLMVSRSGDDLQIESSAGDGTLSMTDKGMVQLIGREGQYTFLRISGSSQEVLSAAAVDQVMAS